jgi:signal transduction histidine kinase
MKTNLKWGILLIMKCSFFVMIFNTESVGQKYADSLIIELNKLNQLPQTIERDSIYTDIFIEFLSQSSNITKKSIQILKMKERIRYSKWKLAFGVSELVKGLYSLRSNQQKLAFYHYEMAYNVFKINDAKKLRLYTANRIIFVNMQELAFSGKIDPILNKNCLNYLIETQSSIDSTSDIMYKVNVELNTAYYYLVNKNYKIAFNHYLNYGNLVKHNKEKYYYHYYNAIWAQNLCLLYMDREQEALKNISYLKNVFETPRDDGVHKLLQVMIATFLGKYNIEKNNYQIAIADINKVYNDSILIKNAHFIPVLDQNLYLAYKGLGDNKKALYFHELFVKFKIENDIKTLNEQFTISQIKNRTAENQAKIKQLENNKLIQENRNNQLTRNMSIAGLLLGLVFLFYNYRKNLQLQSKNQELSLKNEEIQEALLQGQTTERKRMASELHDNISNKILGVKMRVELLENEHFTEKEKINYQATLGFIDEVYEDVRLVSHNLLPEELETKGLGLALENLVKKLNLIGKTHFENSITTLQTRLPARLEYEIYNIILESVNNVLKHAEAKNAMISIIQENNLLKVTVKDNGKGFDNQLVNFDSLGLKSIHSRIEALRGKVEILDNNGTQVLIEVPV